MNRERTFAWSDPRLTADAASGMAGVDFLRGMRDGGIPGGAAGFSDGLRGALDAAEGPGV